jgi:NAD(P)-dependent dehydrogenase (short-subunit alcohol dehydrogenase family)
MYDLSGKVALVTGAGGERGFGRAIAVRLAQEGADVIINDFVQNPYPGRSSAWRGLQSVVQEIEALGRRAVAIVADISDSAQVDKMVREGVEHLGQINILVNNAASSHGRDLVPVIDLEEKVWDATMRVNLKGAFLCSKFVAREMVCRGLGGKIIVMSSAVGKRGQACRAAYAASKFALVGFTQSLALELAPNKINVNAVCPGMRNRRAISGENLQGPYRHNSTWPFGADCGCREPDSVPSFLSVGLSHRPFDFSRRWSNHGLVQCGKRAG